MNKKIPKKVQQVQKHVVNKSEKNKVVSYSELSVYMSCPRKWDLQYQQKLAPYQPSVYTIFGKAIHEVIQHWLEVMYNQSGKIANELDLHRLLYEKMIKNYKQEAARSKQSFSSPNELRDIYLQGTYILDFLKKKRGVYFSLRKVYLVSVESLLYCELRPGLVFKGYIDLVFYDERTDRWLIVDIKTSTHGWKQYDKKNLLKISQLLLYKDMFSKQYNIPIQQIDVEFFIVKRTVPVDADFTIMQRRVQQFKPPSGKIKIGQTLKYLSDFIEDVLDKSNTYVKKQYPAKPSLGICKFCPFFEHLLCKESKILSKK